eukprot:scaffold3366_cov129-Skeletonema_dohrnii-CCMP3373.AAC.8
MSLPASLASSANHTIHLSSSMLTLDAIFGINSYAEIYGAGMQAKQQRKTNNHSKHAITNNLSDQTKSIQRRPQSHLLIII